MKKEEKQLFIEKHFEKISVLGFWDEIKKPTLIQLLEHMYETEIIREWAISDVVMSGNKVLYKWYKRAFPLSDEDLKSQYGR